MAPRPFLLAGDWLDNGPVLPLRSPWSGEVVSEIVQAEPIELARAAESALAALPTTRALPGWQRGQILDAVANGLSRRFSELVRAIVEEAGKPVILAEAEVARAADTLRLSAEVARSGAGAFRALDGTASGSGRAALSWRVPRGPVLAITPFNFPLNLVCHKVGPAVAVGAPLVIKPAEQTPTPALILAELLLDAGWPAEALSVLPCDRSVASQLVEHPAFGVISFTGSAAVGWRLRGLAPRAHVALELGGDATVILEPDADLDAAIPRIALGAFAYAGQICISVQRVLAHDALYDDVRARLLDATAQLRTGDPHERGVICGPMISDAAAQRIEGWVQEAVEDGASLLAGGTRTGRLFAPTVLEGAPLHTSLQSEEAFAPVVLLERYEDLDGAIDRLNTSRFGLQAGLFTSSLPSLFHAAKRLDVGALIHNDTPTFRTDAMPYGGVKESGAGREGPAFAAEDFTELKTLILRTD